MICHSRPSASGGSYARLGEWSDSSVTVQKALLETMCIQHSQANCFQGMPTHRIVLDVEELATDNGG